LFGRYYGSNHYATDFQPQSLKTSTQLSDFNLRTLEPFFIGDEGGREGRNGSGLVPIVAIILLSAAVGALLSRRMDPDLLLSTPEFPTCENGEYGKCEYSIIPTRAHHAPNLAWLCPLCVCLPGKRCDAIHARATQLITNFHAACALCPADSETADSILETTDAHIFFFDVGYPFRAIETCEGQLVHTCVLCDNVTGIAPNCGVDNLGKMRDLHVTSRRDMACRRNDPRQCTCIHAEELIPVSWSECAEIVHRNKNTYASYNSYAHNTQLQESKFVRYLGGDKIEEYYQSCVKQTNQACRPSRFLFPETTTAENGTYSWAPSATLASRTQSRSSTARTRTRQATWR
jgi:hypothetical protein